MPWFLIGLLGFLGLHSLRIAAPAWREARIAVRSVQVSKPSLDEVFLTLTGRPVEEHDADDDAATSEGRVA